MDVDAIADELYGLPLAQFTAARNAYVKQARQAGERDVAASIQALGKPSTAAGLANQLVRHHREEFAPLLELGESLRDAMASFSGPELRTLGQQQHRLIAALVARARSLARADGHLVSADLTRGLEETLHAALADEDAAAELMSGRLTETLHRSGLGAGGPASLRSVPMPTNRSPRVRTQAGARVSTTQPQAGTASELEGGTEAGRQRDRRERADREAAQADRHAAVAELAKAHADLEQANAQAASAQHELDRAKTTVARLERELDRAVSEQSRMDREQHRMRVVVEHAQRALHVAERRRQALG